MAHGSSGDIANCRIGEPVSLSPEIFSGGDKAQTPELVIGCPVLRLQGALKLVAYRRGRTLTDSLLCVSTLFARGSLAENCHGATRLPRRLNPSLFSDGVKGWYFLGILPQRARSVTVRYRSFGRVRCSKVVVTDVRDSELRRRLSLAKPVSLFSSDASFHAHVVVFTARTSTGRILDSFATGDLTQLRG
jgi:hypothetical protein